MVRSQGLISSIEEIENSVVTYPPLDSLADIDPLPVIESIKNSPVHLYFHIPFCETRCTFCHYVVDLYPGKERATINQQAAVDYYLQLLRKEITFYSQLFQQRNIQVDSVYIGGGTPTILSCTQLENLVTNIKDSFQYSNNFPFCIEASPLTITAFDGIEKLKLLVSHGIKRLSFGIQSFNNDVLKIAGRGYTKSTAIEACKLAQQYFTNWNIDLIQSLSQSSMAEIQENLAIIKELKPPHITWYNGRFSEKRPQGKMRQDKDWQKSFPQEREILDGRAFIWQELLKTGYNQIDGNRFVSNKKFIDSFKKVRTSIQADLIGLGVSAYSHTQQYFFRNEMSIKEYAKQIEAKGHAIATGKKFSDEEKIAASYVIGLRTIWQKDKVYQQLTKKKQNQSIINHYKTLVDQLVGNGILEYGKNSLRLTQLGRLYEDEVLAMFYSRTVKRILNSRL